MQSSEAELPEMGDRAGMAGNMDSVAEMTTQLAETSQELKQYLVVNSTQMERYSHELLHVQSLAAQLVQMSNMHQLQ